MNTLECLTIASAIVPDRTAILFDGRRFSYEELQQRSNRLANGLADLGVGSGDRVAVLQVNCNQMVEAYFAAARLDAIFLPLSFRLKGEELAALLLASSPSALLAGSRYMEMVEGLRGDGVVPRKLVCMDGPGTAGWLGYEQLLGEASPEELLYPAGDDEDTTVLMFTAGTTGVPKGVMLSHQSFTSYLLSNVEPPDLEAEQRNLLSVPLYHIAGLQSVLAGIYGGRTLVMMRQFEPLEWMALVEQERPARTMLVPTMLKQLMEHPRFHDFDLSSLEVITYGAAPMPLPVIRQAIAEFPRARFINAFGQTETASTITMLPPDDHDLSGTPDEVEAKLKRLASIGKPLEDVEVRIVNEDGADVAQGEVGEIVARGPRIMKGYWEEEGATRDAIRGDWLYTGDLGYQDGDGYIYLSGRARDIIKRGGEMVSPEEVEQVIMSLPGVEEAAVIGMPDIQWGEVVRAVVVRGEPGLTEAQVIEHCMPRLAGFKRPESVVFVDELPRNPLGKVLKRELRGE